MLAPPVSRTPRDAGCRQPCPSVVRVAAPAARATVRLSTLPHPQRSSLQRLTEIAGTVALQVCKIRERPLPWLYTSTSDSTLILVGAIACPPLFVSSSWTAPGIDSLAPLPHVPANSRGRDRTPSRPPARTPGAEGATAPETLRQTDHTEATSRYASDATIVLRRRNCAPTKPMPQIIIAQPAGSGTPPVGLIVRGPALVSNDPVRRAGLYVVPV